MGMCTEAVTKGTSQEVGPGGDGYGGARWYKAPSKAFTVMFLMRWGGTGQRESILGVQEGPAQEVESGAAVGTTGGAPHCHHNLHTQDTREALRWPLPCPRPVLWVPALHRIPSVRWGLLLGPRPRSDVTSSLSSLCRSLSASPKAVFWSDPESAPKRCTTSCLGAGRGNRSSG